MKTGTKLLMALTVLAVNGAWQREQTKGIEQAGWLVGTWESRTAKGIIYETWRRKDGRELLGRSYAVKGNDTITFEDIRIVRERDGLFYIPIVKNQNQGLPVRFRSSFVSATKLVFENPGHDFPQVISYTKAGPDSLLAEISGVRQGQARRQVFPMKQVK